MNGLSPQLLLIMEGKMSRYPPLNEQNEQYPPKMSKNEGDQIFFSIYSYIHLWKKIVIRSSPQNGGIVYRGCVGKQYSTFHLHSKDLAYEQWFSR